MRAYSRTVPWKPPSKRRVRAIRDRLRELYGRPVNHPHGDPVHELVKTILSQNTSDTNRDAAYERLRERFDTWEEVRDAPVSEVADAIRPGRPVGDQGPAHPGGRCAAAARRSISPGSRDAPRDEAIDVSDLASRGGPQDRRLRPDLLLRPPRDPGRHPCLPRRGAPRPVSPSAPRSRRRTTRCCGWSTPRTPTSCTST